MPKIIRPDAIGLPPLAYFYAHREPASYEEAVELARPVVKAQGWIMYRTRGKWDRPIEVGQPSEKTDCRYQWLVYEDRVVVWDARTALISATLTPTARTSWERIAEDD